MEKTQHSRSAPFCPQLFPAFSILVQPCCIKIQNASLSVFIDSNIQRLRGETMRNLRRVPIRFHNLELVPLEFCHSALLNCDCGALPRTHWSQDEYCISI